VRNRLLLVAKRLEATPLFESTINADFRHFIGGGLKIEYHLNDMLSFGGIGVFTTALDTKLTKRIKDTLETAPNDMTREPSIQEFEQRLNSMPLHGALYVSLTPWYGKLAAFGKAYVNFDFYFQGGFGFATLKSGCEDSICNDSDPFFDDPTTPTVDERDANPNNDRPLNDGFRPGLYLAGGIHVFVSDFIALDLAVRDYAFMDNPSGADFNADEAVGENPRDDIGNDNRFLHHLFVGVGVSIMLPMKVKRTR
jgi:outer membrane beta-barrel protein